MNESERLIALLFLDKFEEIDNQPANQIQVTDQQQNTDNGSVTCTKVIGKASDPKDKGRLAERNANEGGRADRIVEFPNKKQKS